MYLFQVENVKHFHPDKKWLVTPLKKKSLSTNKQLQNMNKELGKVELSELVMS